MSEECCVKKSVVAVKKSVVAVMKSERVSEDRLRRRDRGEKSMAGTHIKHVESCPPSPMDSSSI